MKTIVILTSLCFIAAGCNSSNNFGTNPNVKLVPDNFENPKQTRDIPSDAAPSDYEDLNLPAVEDQTSNPAPIASQDKPEPRKKVQTVIVNSKPDEPVVKVEPTKKPDAPAPVPVAVLKPKAAIEKTTSEKVPAVVKPLPPAPKAAAEKSAGLLDRASDFVKKAIWVMVNEGKKIGTPCNYYLRRVLEYAGFKNAPFLANDFGKYADKYFSGDNKQTFKSGKVDRVRLHEFLWSFPSSTPFIMNWHKQSVRYGHVAIVERYDNTLVIYQASIGSFSARQDKTTVESLLDETAFGRDLTVHANFSKK